MRDDRVVQRIGHLGMVNVGFGQAPCFLPNLLDVAFEKRFEFEAFLNGHVWLQL